MKKIKTMGMGLFGFFLAALIAFNVQVGTGSKIVGISKVSAPANPKLIVKRRCPPKQDTCMRIEWEGYFYTFIGKPITVTG
jgi:hypothetical protein